MNNKYLIRFYYDVEHSITLPVKADQPKTISDSIVSAYFRKQTWLSFPTRDRFTSTFGTEQVTVNLERVKYFKVELPTKLYLEKYAEEDFMEWCLK